jgi:hypothetical protein
LNKVFDINIIGLCCTSGPRVPHRVKKESGQYHQQPSARIGTVLKLIKALEAANPCVLNKVLGGLSVSRQSNRSSG